MSIKSLDIGKTIFSTVAILLIGPFCFAEQSSDKMNERDLASRNGTTQKKAFREATPSPQSEQLSSSLAPKREMPRWELRTAPLALLVNWYTLDVSYRISEKWSIGPAAVVYGSSDRGNMFAPSYNGYAVGLNLNYYFDSVLKSGWYLSSHSYFEDYKSYRLAYSGYKDKNGFRSNAALGYQWRSYNINYMMGVGGEFRSHSVIDSIKNVSDTQPVVSTYTENELLLHLEFKIGIQF